MSIPTSADVYKNKIFVGKISRTQKGSIFEYDPEYLKNVDPKEGGIAVHLPYTRPKTETVGVNLHTYFAGLLPEGLRLQALIRHIKTSQDDLLSLLIAAGTDCIGDIAVVEHKKMLTRAVAAVNVRKLKEASFPDLFKNSIAQLNPQESSVPGVQEKVSAAMISFPIKKGSGRYILKLNPPDKERLVENEYFFLQMAKDCGLQTAQARLVYDRDKNTGLLVERFDRKYDSEQKEIIKLHQEDACQFLDRYPADKYLIQCSEITAGLAKYCTSSHVEVGRFLQLLAFSYLVGNGDLHAKNVSIIKIDGLIRLTPAYDLISTIPYGDQKMALKFDGQTDNFKKKMFIEFGSRFGVGPAIIKDYLEKICDCSSKWISRVDEIGLDTRKSKFLKSVIEKRRKDLGT